MKKTITLLVSLLSVTAFSQFPEISATNQIPSVGDTIEYNDANTFGFDENGSGGAINVMWDFSNLIPTGSVKFFYVDMATTGDQATFPSANIAMGNNNTSGYEYFEVGPSTIKRWGYSSTTDTLKYHQAFTRYSFPIQPGVTQTASYIGQFITADLGQDSTTISNGSYDANPDAYGTVKLPPSAIGGQPEVFDSVIRVHVVESFQIIYWMLGVPALTININDDYYFWFDEETQEPIVIYGTTTDDAGGSPQTVLRYQPIAGTATQGGTSGIEENDKITFNIFPNPAKDVVSLSFKNSNSRRIKIISVIGETVLDKETSKKKEILNVSSLKSGVYFIEINEGDQKQIKKIIL